MTNLIAVLVMTLELSSTLKDAKVTRHLTDAQRVEYASFIAASSIAHGVDPLLVTAVIWVESNFRNLPKNKSNDYGLMQLHWQREPWLAGLTRQDLLKPRINIEAGVKELAHVKKFCRRWRHRGHHWWAHYLYGPKVKARWYGRRVERWRAYFQRVRERVRNRPVML